MNTEIETKSSPAEEGDMVVARNDNNTPAEQYLVKANKFPKLYDEIPVENLGEWTVYKVKPEARNVFFWTEELKSQLEPRGIYSQQEFFEFAKNQQTVLCQKHLTVLAKAASVGEIILTKVGVNNKPISIMFMAVWNEPMTVKEGDALIVTDDEVYRIARSEFNMTYNLL
jgi:hypothetical protein